MVYWLPEARSRFKTYLGMIPGLSLVGAAAALALPCLAHAESAGPYFSVNTGFHLLQDADLGGGGIANSVEFDPGWLVGGAAGYAFGNGLRTEVDIAYANADVGSITGAGGSGSTGDVSAMSAMANLFYDFETGTPVVPYVGGGLGFARIAFDGVSRVGNSRIDDQDNVFAYQGIAGAGYRLNGALALFADYRYVATNEPSFQTDAGREVDGEYADHRFTLGLRWSLGGERQKPQPRRAEAPAAAEAPAEAPVLTTVAEVQMPKTRVPEAPPPYVVYFDWNRAQLSPEALAVLREAAASAKAGQHTRIEATGHADRSGPAAYNLLLSLRRAKAVQSELVALGVAEAEITVLAKGEDEPTIATADGLREPRNRRVELVLQ